MNHYCLDEIYIGQIESFCVVISEEMLQRFRDLTGDLNPLHQDEKYAKEKGFEGIVVYGHLVASFFSTLAGVYLPGERSLIHEIHYKFMKPVYIADELEITGKVSEKDARVNQITIKVRIRRKSDDTTVLRGNMLIGVMK